MREVRIALIMPGKSQTRTERGHPWMPSSTLFHLAGIISATDPTIEVVICDEITGERLNVGNLPSADWYWISGFTPSRIRAHELAGMIIGMGRRVLGGGMDVTGQYHDGGGDELVDVFKSVVVGILTTELCSRLLRDFKRSDLQPIYQAVASDEIEWILPRHDLITSGREVLPGTHRSSRGCRHRCPFCSVHLMYPNLECMPAELLEQELSILQRSPVELDVADDFGGDPDFVREVVLPIRKRRDRPWVTETSALSLLGDSKQAGLLNPTSAAGCIGYYVGIETRGYRISDKSLGPQYYEELVRAVHGRSGIILGSFILDLDPKATVESVKAEIHWAIDQKFDFAQFSLQSAHVGTKLRELALKHGWVLSDYPEHYDGAWPTVAHPILTPKEQIELLKYAYQTFYSPANIGKRVWANHPHLRLMVGAYRQIVRSSREWWGEKMYDYDYWARTRIIPA